MNNKVIDFIEKSFLSDLLTKEGVTDISYNGVDIFYLQNMYGRRKYETKVSCSEVIDFVRQIANLTEKQFSFTNPFLDVSIGKYRINAVHSSIVRVDNEKSCSFSIRIASGSCKILDDYYFLNKTCRRYLDKAIKEGKSLVIGGPTGCGKTELQKYLLLKMPANSRVIAIDNVEELEYVRSNKDVDFTSWQISQTNANASIQQLVRNGLRSNPDWLVIAESRGSEMNEILNSVMTGHPIITTIHAESIDDIPNRLCRMVEMAGVTQNHESILLDIYKHIKVCIYVLRKITKTGVKRFVQSISEINSDGTMNYIYRREK